MTWLVQGVNWVLRISTPRRRGRALFEERVTAIAPRGRRRGDRGGTVNFMAQAEVGRRVGPSQVELAGRLGIARNTRRYWQARQANLEGSPKVAAFFESPEGLAVRHQICGAAHLVIEFDPGRGVRGVCDFLRLSGLSRLVASSYGAQHPVASQMEANLVRYDDVTQSRLAPRMAPRKITARRG